MSDLVCVTSVCIPVLTTQSKGLTFHVCMCVHAKIDSTYFLRQILNIPKMDSWVSLASLGGQCSPGTHLSLPTPSGRVTEMFHCTQLFMWVLAGQTQVCAAGTSQLNHHLHSPKQLGSLWGPKTPSWKNNQEKHIIF